jgi:hypothetical protein
MADLEQVCPACGADLAALSAREVADRRLLGPERTTADA